MISQNIKTRLFLDSGDSLDTQSALRLLGSIDGQTTNPSLIAKNPQAQERLVQGNKFTLKEVNDFYKQVVNEISHMIPNGSVSIEVAADATTSSENMMEQARSMFQWIPNAHIKLPTTREGLKAARMCIDEGMRVNMTLVFSQEQAAAVYAATKGAKKGDVFLSPFIGRLDDIGLNGMDLISNVLKMYQKGDGHVEVLTASVRSMQHFMGAITLGSDIITSPLSILQLWKDQNCEIPEGFKYEMPQLQPIAFQDLDLEKSWASFNIQHDLTDKGLVKFAEDWGRLIQSSEI